MLHQLSVLLVLSGVQKSNPTLFLCQITLQGDDICQYVA